MRRTTPIRAGLFAAVKVALAAAVAIAAGCGFDPAGDSGDDGGGPDAGGIDAFIVTPLCDAEDPTLRLCLGFEGGSMVNGAGDTATVVTAQNVGFVDGAVGHSVRVFVDSVIHVAENPALDVTDQMTLEAFVQVLPDFPPETRAGVVDNNAQYGLWIDPQFTPYCQLPGTMVTGQPLTPGTWTHLACVFDGQTYAIYQGGTLVAQVSRPTAILTSGNDGLNVGQDCRAGGESGDPLDGSIDEVRLWSVARTPAQIAEAAARP